MKRARLPHRRPAVTHTISFLRGDGASVEYQASVGFDDRGWPKEVFLFGAKAGSDMAAALADTAVALSVALQSSVRAEAMARSVSRVTAPDGSLMPGSIVGAALDLLAQYERDREAIEDGVR